MAKDRDIEFGQRLERIRKDSKLSRDKLAEIIGCGITPTKIANMERNGTMPSDEHRAALEAWFGSPAAALSTAETPSAPSAKQLNGSIPSEDESAVYLLTEDDLDEEIEWYGEPATGVVMAAPDLADAVVVDDVSNVIQFPVRQEIELPLTTRLVSHSELRTFWRCRRKWWLSYVRGLRLRDESMVGALQLGTRVHQALEAWYQPEGSPREDPRTALENVLGVDRMALATQLQEKYGEVSPERLLEFDRDADLARAMISGYVEWLHETGADEDIEVIAPEVTVTAPLNDDVTLIGRLDAKTLRRHSGKRSFIDHKPQPLSEPVLTPMGWRTMGDLEPGDEVIGSDGRPTKVLEVFDRGEDAIWEITFNDRTTVRATADHPWLVRPWRNGLLSVVETKDLPLQWRTAPFTPARDDVDADLPLHPYALGAWIANGGRGSNVSDGEEAPMAYLAQCVDREYYVIDRDGRARQWGVKFGATEHAVLKMLGLSMLFSRDRFIPSEYIYRASYRQRLELLRGLMDADGTLTMTKSATYTTTSERLARDVADLARSLGAWAVVNVSDRHSHVGTKEDGYDTDTFPCWVPIRSDFNPFSQSKHAVSWVENKNRTRGHKGVKTTEKIIKNVRPLDRREDVRCIRVAAENHLYVTSGWTLTHNTTADMNASTRGLPMDTQMLMYMLLETMAFPDIEQTPTALYNMLRKVKRTARANPPFYDRVEVAHNAHELAAFADHLGGSIVEMQRIEEQLASGVVHHWVVPPHPTRDCNWDCPFVAVCPMFDDGSRVEDALTTYYVEEPGTAYKRYTKELEG